MVTHPTRPEGPPGTPCQVKPEGDHLARYLDAYTAGQLPDRPEPRALPARQEVHLHFHGITAADVAEVLARVNHGDRGRVD